MVVDECFLVRHANTDFADILHIVGRHGRKSDLVLGITLKGCSIGVEGKVRIENTCREEQWRQILFLHPGLHPLAHINVDHLLIMHTPVKGEAGKRRLVFDPVSVVVLVLARTTDGEFLEELLKRRPTLGFGTGAAMVVDLAGAASGVSAIHGEIFRERDRVRYLVAPSLSV